MFWSLNDVVFREKEFDGLGMFFSENHHCLLQLHLRVIHEGKYHLVDPITPGRQVNYGLSLVRDYHEMVDRQQWKAFVNEAKTHLRILVP